MKRKVSPATMALLRITSADIAGILRKLNQAGIALHDVVYLDELTVQLGVRSKDYKDAYSLLQDTESKITVLNKDAAHWRGWRLLHRPMLLTAIVVLLCFVFCLPGRIYFVEVEGNYNVPTNLILEKAELCGIGFGASRRQVRSEKIKNALLESIPQLQWAGVNTAGCVATISVEEKSIVEEKEENLDRISSIVASRDAVILDYTATSGNVLCKVGEAVKAGQTLISGYTDCGIVIKATQARGEVYARTLHELELICPSDYTVRSAVTNKQERISLQIGKKLIKLYKDSGISPGSCVKMYSTKQLTLPGGFQLPVTLITETLVFYDTDASAQEQAADWLPRYASSYLNSQMVAGLIEQADTQLWSGDGVSGMTGKYMCTEMIGRVQYEQMIQGDSKGD